MPFVVDPSGTAVSGTAQTNPYFGWQHQDVRGVGQPLGPQPNFIRPNAGIDPYRAKYHMMQQLPRSYPTQPATQLNRYQKLGGAFKSYLGSNTHRSGMRWAKGGFSGYFGRSLAGLSIVSGYMDDGMWGAAKGLAQYAAADYVLGAGIHMAGLAASTGGVGALAIGGLMGYHYGKRALGKSISDYTKKHAKLEMVTPVQDPFGTVATMRRRSLMAMRQSRLNGRSALGNEALSNYRPY